MRIRSLLALSLATSLAPLPLTGCAQLRQAAERGDLQALLGGGEVDVAAGLKEALRVGVERAVADLSAKGGFGDSAARRIALPDRVANVTDTLRKIGLGKTVDDVEAAMNRAAERASAEAVPIFRKAIGSMTLADAKGILEGGETAATDYFRSKTEDDLRDRFQPVIAEKLSELRVVRDYNELLAKYKAIPFVPKPAELDLDRYVTDRGLDGLFGEIAAEEKRIREDPKARTTELLPSSTLRLVRRCWLVVPTLSFAWRSAGRAIGSPRDGGR